MAGWSMLGAPLDCSGQGRGEALAPAALRAAAIADSLGAADLGDIAIAIDDATRDTTTGVIGFEQIRAGSVEIRRRLAETLATEARPLVVGGDCTLLIGVFAALRDRVGRAGLWFVDGHPDFYDGRTSPTGEAADMDLAVLTGHGPPGLVDLGGSAPLVEPSDVVVLGHRAAADADGPEELGLVDMAIHLVDAPAISRAGPAVVGAEIEARLAAALDHVWLHLDLDVLDEAALPAVSYPQSGGLDWEEVEALIRPPLGSSSLAGLSVADFNPERDRDGRYARRVVDLLRAVLPDGTPT